jgi:hypothetical protein
MPTDRTDAMFDSLERAGTRHRHDQVEAIFIQLYEEESPVFRRYLEARDVEGSREADEFMAAVMIRDRAKLLKLLIAREKLATIVEVLGVVLRTRGLRDE